MIASLKTFFFYLDVNGAFERTQKITVWEIDWNWNSREIPVLRNELNSLKIQNMLLA